MHSVGLLHPATPAAVRERFGAVGPTAQTLVRSTTKAMDFDREEYDSRVTGDVVQTAHEALFGSLLEVTVADRDAFDEWCAETDYDVTLLGSDSVAHVAFHPVEFEGVVVGATFQNEERAAVETLRRHVFGEYYRPVVEDDD